MTGNTALDIFIGLVFVYLLYSLFAAVILEILTTWIKLRGANLYRTISTMLNDAKAPRGWKWGTRFWWFLVSVAGYNKSQKIDGLAEKFYESNGIKYLGGSVWKKNRPSTISAEQFSKGLMEVMLKEADPNQAQAESIKNFLEEQSTGDGDIKHSSSGIDYLNYLFKQAQGDVNKFKALIEAWYEEMMTISKEWYKQRVQIWLFAIGLWLAVVFNLNTLYITKVLSLNNHARQQMVEMASAFLQNNKYTHPDSVRNMDEKALLAYQREIQKQAEEASAVLSLPKNFPDRIEVLKVLSGARFVVYRDSMNDSAGRSIVTSFVHFEDRDAYAILKQPKELPYLNIGEFVVPGSKEVNKGDTVLYSHKKGCFRYRLNKSRGPYLNRLGTAWTSIGEFSEYQRDTSEVKEKKGAEGLQRKGVAILQDSVNHQVLSSNPKVAGISSSKFVYFDKGRYFWRYQIWGFLITALAISLGAPFWYDLLNKLMRLRSVTQPAPAAAPVAQKKSTNKPDDTVG